jgi:hypothetical protein
MVDAYRGYIIAAAVAMAVILAVSVTAVVLTAKEQKKTAAEEEPQIVEILQQETEEETEQPETTADDEYPFNIMSRDWSGEDLQGFQSYTIPQEYQKEGGAFPDVMQKYTYIVCNQAGVDYAVALAVIEVESGYKWDAVGDKEDTGYMQIVQKFHEERMERLNADNLLDPFQNVRVGVDYLQELLEKYNGSYEKALTAYQNGASGAYKYFFSAGVDCSPYAEKVLEIAERIRTEVKQGEQ